MTRPTTVRTVLDRATSEADLLNAVRQLARLAGWRTYHTRDSRGSEPGFPDLILLRPPRLLVAECKTQTGRLTRDQAAWLADLTAAGIETYLWRPSDWPAITATLTRRPDRP